MTRLNGLNLRETHAGLTSTRKRRIAQTLVGCLLLFLTGIGIAWAETCTHQFEYFDGSVVPVDSCAGLTEECIKHANEPESGHGYRDDIYLCREICQWTQITEEDLGTYIRGVPTLDQHIVEDLHPIACGHDIYVGCGPIAGASLVAWYDGTGWPNLSRGFLSPQRKLKWKRVAETLRDEHFGSACVPFSGGQTATTGKAMARGLKSFFEDQGYALTTEYDRVKPDEMADAFERVKDEVDAGRPVVMVYCSAPNDPSCNGLGIKDIAITHWSMAHIGLITGYNAHDNTVYVNTGWGKGGNRTYDWSAGVGAVRLVYVRPDDEPVETRTWCAASNPGAHLVPKMVDGVEISYTAEEYEFKDHPVLERYTDEGECELIGGILTSEESMSRSTVLMCDPDLEQYDAQSEPETEPSSEPDASPETENPGNHEPTDLDAPDLEHGIGTELDPRPL